MKEGYEDEAALVFDGTQIIISKEEKKYLGSAIGKQTFIERYVQQKVTTLLEELECLSSIAIIQPHATLIHGLTSRWMYLTRTTPNIDVLINSVAGVG